MTWQLISFSCGFQDRFSVFLLSLSSNMAMVLYITISKEHPFLKFCHDNGISFILVKYDKEYKQDMFLGNVISPSFPDVYGVTINLFNQQRGYNINFVFLSLFLKHAFKFFHMLTHLIWLSYALYQRKLSQVIPNIHTSLSKSKFTPLSLSLSFC